MRSRRVWGDGVHQGRWLALTIWIVAFTLITAYALYNQRTQAHKTDKRFCDVTDSTIKATIDLRTQLNKNDVETIGLRQTVQRAARNGEFVFGLAPSSPVFSESVRRAVLIFFQATDSLNESQITLGRQALAQSDAFVDRLHELRTRLKCPS